MKKILSIFLSVLMLLMLSSCTQTLNSTINANGSVSSVTEMLLTQEEYNQLGLMGEETTGSDTEIQDVTIDGVQYKKIIETTAYDSISDFKEEALSSFDSNISLKDIWFMLKEDYTQSNDVSAINLIFTMPYKIAKTNGEKISDYTVQFNEVKANKYYYLTTDASTDSWTKSDNIEKEITKDFFQETKVVNFNFTPILSSDLKSVKLTNKSGYVVLNNKNCFTDGYNLSYIEVYRKTDKGNFVKIGERNLKTPIKDTIYTDKTIKPNKKYTYRIRGVYKEDNFIKYSSFNTSKSVIVKPAAPTITVKSKQKGCSVVGWKKIKGVDGYQIYRSTKNNSGYKSVKTINKLGVKTFKDTKIKSGKVYFYKIRSYKVINNKRVYSDFSTIKKIKIK